METIYLDLVTVGKVYRCLGNGKLYRVTKIDSSLDGKNTSATIVNIQDHNDQLVYPLYLFVSYFSE